MCPLLFRLRLVKCCSSGVVCVRTSSAFTSDIVGLRQYNVSLSLPLISTYNVMWSANECCGWSSEVLQRTLQDCMIFSRWFTGKSQVFWVFFPLQPQLDFTLCVCVVLIISSNFSIPFFGETHRFRANIQITYQNPAVFRLARHEQVKLNRAQKSVKKQLSELLRWAMTPENAVGKF